MIKNTKFAVFTDIHFGIHANNKQFIEVCKNTMNWIANYCRDNEIKDVLFCGDFFDSRSSIDVNTLNAAAESLYDLANKVEGVTMILGNHDLYLRDSTSIHSLFAFSGHGRIDIISNPKDVVINGKTILLLPWLFGTSSSYIDNVPHGTKYVFCHHNFPANYFMGGGRNSKKRVSDSFASKTPYEDELGMQNELVKTVIDNNGIIFSGHIHQSREFSLSSSSRFIIGGSPYETNWGFGDSKCGMYIFDLESDAVEFIENPYNKAHVELRTSDKDDIEFANIENCIVRLVVDTQEPFETISKIQSSIRSRNPFIVDNTKYEFETAEFIGKRDETENPLNSITDKPSSKMDYIMKAIDNSDFSQFAYNSGNEITQISKERIKKLADSIFEKVAK